MIDNPIYLELKTKNIIELSQSLLNDESCVDPNRFVLGVILKEFTEILKELSSNHILVQVSRDRPIGCLFTISDSADSNFDKDLYDKIVEFKNLCLLVDEREKIYMYNKKLINKHIKWLINLSYVEMRASEIIELCKALLADKSCVDPNRFVVGVVLREFTEILNSLSTNQKLLLSCKARPIYSLSAISESANSDFNRHLLDKLEEFKNLCLLVDESDKIYQHDDDEYVEEPARGHLCFIKRLFGGKKK